MLTDFVATSVPWALRMHIVRYFYEVIMIIIIRLLIFFNKAEGSFYENNKKSCGLGNIFCRLWMDFDRLPFYQKMKASF